MTQPPPGSWPPPGNPPPPGWSPQPPQGQYPYPQTPYPGAQYPQGQYPQGQYHPPQTPPPVPQPTWGPPTTQPLSNPNPYAPIGADKPKSVSIDQFTTPRSKAPWIIIGVAAVLLAGMLWMGSNVDRLTATPDSASSQTRTTTAPSMSANGVEFHSTWDDADGIFEILDSTWTSRGLELDVRIRVASGSSFTFGFFALDNTTTDEYSPLDIPGTGYLSAGTVRGGESVRGKVVFPKDRGDTTVILSDSTDRQVTALSVRG